MGEVVDFVPGASIWLPEWDAGTFSCLDVKGVPVLWMRVESFIWACSKSSPKRVLHIRFVDRRGLNCSIVFRDDASNPVAISLAGLLAMELEGEVAMEFELNGDGSPSGDIYIHRIPIWHKDQPEGSTLEGSTLSQRINQKDQPGNEESGVSGQRINLKSPNDQPYTED